jgi:hypothetical protein
LRERETDGQDPVAIDCGRTVVEDGCGQVDLLEELAVLDLFAQQ